MAVQLISTTNFTTAFAVLPFIQTLDRYYPDIDHWYINKVIPGLLLGGDKLIVAKDGGHIAGIALGRAVKRNPSYGVFGFILITKTLG